MHTRITLCFILLAMANQSRGNDHKIVIAHRGASAYLPEHTLAGAAMAHSWDVDFIEPDVVLSKDKVPIVLHDIHLDLTTNVKDIFPQKKRVDGRYYAIDFTLKELKQLNVQERISHKTGKIAYPGRFPVRLSSFQIPTLAEFIELIKGLNTSRQKKIGIYPEVKAPSFHLQAGADISKIVIKILKEYGYEKNTKEIYLQCFNAKELQRIRREFNPPYPLIQLIGDNRWYKTETDFTWLQTQEGLASIAKYAQGIGPWINQLLSIDEQGRSKMTNLATLAKANKLLIHPYTLRSDRLPKGINFEKLAKLLYYQVEVDGIFTDFGNKLVSLLERQSTSDN